MEAWHIQSPFLPIPALWEAEGNLRLGVGAEEDHHSDATRGEGDRTVRVLDDRVGASCWKPQDPHPHSGRRTSQRAETAGTGGPGTVDSRKQT